MRLGVEGFKMVLVDTPSHTNTHAVDVLLFSLALRQGGHRLGRPIAPSAPSLRFSSLCIYILSPPLSLSHYVFVPPGSARYPHRRKHCLQQGDASCHLESDLFNREILAFTSFWLLSETELWIESWLVVHPTHSHDPRESGPHAVTPSWVFAPPTVICSCIQISLEAQEHLFYKPLKAHLQCIVLFVTGYNECSIVYCHNILYLHNTLPGVLFRNRWQRVLLSKNSVRWFYSQTTSCTMTNQPLYTYIFCKHYSARPENKSSAPKSKRRHWVLLRQHPIL